MLLVTIMTVISYLVTATVVLGSMGLDVVKVWCELFESL